MLLKKKNTLRNAVDSDFIDELWLSQFCKKHANHGPGYWSISNTSFLLCEMQSGPHFGYYNWQLFTTDEDGCDEFDICIVKRRDQLQNVLNLLTDKDGGWNHAE